jgi:tetratricopeptide (TPR) repeat protein
MMTPFLSPGVDYCALRGDPVSSRLEPVAESVFMLPDLSLLPLPLATFDGRMSSAQRDRPSDDDLLAAARARFTGAVGGNTDGAAAKALLALALAYASAGRYAEGIAQCTLAAELASDAVDGVRDGAAENVLALQASCLHACLLAEAERFEEAIDLFAVLLASLPPRAQGGRSDADASFPTRADRDAPDGGDDVRTSADAGIPEAGHFDATLWRLEAAVGAALCQATLGRGTEAKATLERVLPHLQTWIAAAQGGANEADARHLMVRFGYAQVRSLLSLHQPVEALAALAQIAAMGAGNAEQMALLQAVAYLSLGRPMQAVAPLEAVFALHPDDPSALVLYGQTMAALGEYAFAVDRFEAALRVKPRFAPAYRYMASALAMQKNDAAALVCLRAARDIRPDFPEVWLDEAGVRLRCGQLRRGFAAYEWRDGARLAARRSDRYWNGDDSLAGRSLLVVAEQGLGDAIHFMRYIPLVKALAREVVVEVQVPLWRLAAARAEAWGVRVIPRGTPLPECDRFTLLMSLPYALQTTLSTIPSGVPYLFAAPALALPRLAPVAEGGAVEGAPFPCTWRVDGEPRTHIAVEQGAAGNARVPLRVGLVVSGNPEYRNDALRSMPLSMCAPMLALDGIEYIMLQPTLRDADRQWIADRKVDGGAANWHAGLLDMPQGDFADTAAIVETLDLVISVDTAIAHLSGALGKPVWLMLPYVADWRWLSDRSDSPWYPSARLFRQHALQDWPSVIADLVDALLRRTAA